MTRRGLILTLSVIAIAAIGIMYMLMRTEPKVPPVGETKPKQEPPQLEEQKQSEPRQVEQPRQVQQPPQAQSAQQPQAPWEDPERPQMEPLAEPPPDLPTHERVVADVSAIRGKLEDYNSRMGEFPATVEGLRALGVALPKDRWGHDYIYNSPSTRNRESYDLFSAGPDGLPDTPDDDWGEKSEEDNPGNPD